MRIVRLRPWVLILISIVLLSGILYYTSKVIIWYTHINENQEVIGSIKKNIVVKEEKVEIDFDALKRMNPDTVAYIKVNHTNIDYIVVKGNDNSYYLNHNFEKKWNVAGWIFGDYRNQFDESDKNLIIYGHNTKDGSMFDTLIHVLSKDWQENKENRDVLLITEQGTYHYNVFSTYSIIPEDYYIKTSFNNKEEFQEFVHTLKSRSIYDYQEEVGEDDKILTLSSCIGEGKKRVVLHAKLVKKEEDS